MDREPGNEALRIRAMIENRVCRLTLPDFDFNQMSQYWRNIALAVEAIRLYENQMVNWIHSSDEVFPSYLLDTGTKRIDDALRQLGASEQEFVRAYYERDYKTARIRLLQYMENNPEDAAMLARIWQRDSASAKT
jgi:hypothetical protein